MMAYRDFLFSIVYPPNPEQLSTRVLSEGTGATPGIGDPNDPADGDGAQRGLKLYAIKGLPSCQGRSCIQCHWLPEGSDNKLSDFLANTFTPSNRQPFETPAIRFLRQKERRIETGALADDDVSTGLFGLAHEGTRDSINEFLFIGFEIGGDLRTEEEEDVQQFVREFDTGIGPLVGRSVYVDTTTKAALDTTEAFDLWEGQAGVANVGLAVELHTVASSTPHGFWYDLTESSVGYRNDQDGSLLSRSDLLALLLQPGDRLVLHGTALGSERRTAWQSAGTPPVQTGPPPGMIRLEQPLPNSMYRDLPELTANWEPVETGGTFDWLGDDIGQVLECAVMTPPVTRAVRILQYGVIQDGGGLGGVFWDTPKHEFPRRLRVSMVDGRHGAKLRLKLGTDANNAPPNSTTFLTFELPIHPTDSFNGSARIWETHVEFDALNLYSLMLGGPAAPNVSETLDLSFTMEPPPMDTFNPDEWNSFWVEVSNPDGTPTGQVGVGGWQSLTL
jgi:hypothetical protein